MGIGRWAWESPRSSLEMIFSFWLFKTPFSADDINAKSMPRGALALAKVALSFRAHLRPLSMQPPVLPAPQCPRRTAGAALGTAIPLAAAFSGNKKPKVSSAWRNESAAVQLPARAGRLTNYYNYYCFVLAGYFGALGVFLEDFFEGLNFSILLWFVCAWWSFFLFLFFLPF